MKKRHLLMLAGLLFLLSGRWAEGTVYFSDGGTHIINYVINDTVQISGVGTHVYLVDGGWIERPNEYSYVSVTDYAQFTMTGGYIASGKANYGLLTENYGTFTITGGEIDGWLGVVSYNPSHVYGGILGEHISLDSPWPDGSDGDLYLYGTDFKINGVTAAYGEYYPDDEITLTGTLSNGDPIHCTINCVGGNQFILAPVPEPATLGMLIIGGCWVCRNRRN